MKDSRTFKNIKTGMKNKYNKIDRTDKDFYLYLATEYKGWIKPYDEVESDIMFAIVNYEQSKDKAMSLFEEPKDKDKKVYLCNFYCESCSKEVPIEMSYNEIESLIYDSVLNGTHLDHEYVCDVCEKKGRGFKIRKKKKLSKIKDILLGFRERDSDPVFEFDDILEVHRLFPEIAFRLRSMKYRDFLRTVYWRYISAHIKEESGKRCSLCGRYGSMNVHHRTYENHGEEALHTEDLICLCSKCHKNYHKK